MPAHQTRRQLGMTMGLLALRHGMASTQRDYGVPRGYLQYWRREVLQLSHSGYSWGGARYRKYSLAMEMLVEAYIQYFTVAAGWCTSLGELVAALQSVAVSRWWIHDRFKRWGWTWACATTRSRAKYSIANLIHYCAYLSWTRTIPWVNFKFADESSFPSRELLPTMTIGPRGSRREIVRPWTTFADRSTYSLTGLCSIDPHRPPISIHVNTGTNSQWTFLEAVLGWIENGDLVRGDVLIIDNCNIPSGAAAQPILQAVLQATGVQLGFLPTYSPELNPMEPLWALSKAWLRHHRGFQPFLLEIATAFSQISRATVFNCFINCLTHISN